MREPNPMIITEDDLQYIESKDLLVLAGILQQIREAKEREYMLGSLKWWRMDVRGR